MSAHAARKRVEKASQDPGYRQWLTRMEAELAAFLQQDVPAGFPAERPYFPDALTRVAQDLVDRFPDWEALAEDPAETVHVDRLLRYYGQAWVEAFEGEWINVPAAEDRTPSWEKGPGVRLPFFELYHQPLQMTRNVLNRRDPDLPAWVHGQMTELHRQWIADGRPTVY